MSAHDATDPGDASTTAKRSAITLLADPASRAVVLALGDVRGQALSVVSITDRSLLDVVPRLIRDRVRDLARTGIVEPSERGRSASKAAPRWALTAAGQDLYRLYSLMTRIVSHAAQLDATIASATRERAVENTLKALSDPVVLQVVRSLAEEGPLDPLELEARCHPTPRRTLYRRLSPLVDGGAVLRETTQQVPRSTSYELADRWRPAAAIPVLSTWWMWRHVALIGEADNVDLEGLLAGILPLVRTRRAWNGRRVQWIVEGGADGADPSFVASAKRLELSPRTDDTAAGLADATIVATPAAWAFALVTDQRDGLELSGDADFANETLEAVRAALLAYVR